MKKPPANASKEAVALRKAAQAFGLQPDEPAIGDPHDRAGHALNKNLLGAALRYAHAVLSERLAPVIARNRDDVGAASSNADARYFDTTASTLEDALAVLSGKRPAGLRPYQQRGLAAVRRRFEASRRPDGSYAPVVVPSPKRQKNVSASPSAGEGESR